jgi:hypothetical protein
MEGAHRVRGFVLGSWTRLLIAAGIILALWAVFIGLAISGRLGELRYLNLPLLHPYPPAGYVQNPWNTGDKGDLISVSEASQVRADLLKDGQAELRALEKGDASTISDAAIGRARERISALIDQNNSGRVFERENVKLDSVVVGRLADPNDPSIVWMVEEKGSGTITYVPKIATAPVRSQKVRFTSRFWLTKVGGHYLIADALVQATPEESQ